MLRMAFKLALRQTEGLMTSVFTLMGLTLSAPDHSTLSRRTATLPVIQTTSVPPGPLHVLIDSTGLQVYGTGQWLEAKHGAKSRRTWRKLHLAVDAASGMIAAQTLTDQDTDDPSQVGPLLEQIDDPIGRVTADGVYDGDPIYQTIAAHGDGVEVVIPPRSTAIPSGELNPPTQRDRHLAMITEQGRLAWQVDRLWPAFVGGNDNGSPQGTDWTAFTSPRLCCQRWLAKFGQVDKWSFCLRAARMPRIRSNHDETIPPDPRTGIQGQSGPSRHQGGEDAGRIGAAV